MPLMRDSELTEGPGGRRIVSWIIWAAELSSGSEALGFFWPWFHIGDKLKPVRSFLLSVFGRQGFS